MPTDQSALLVIDVQNDFCPGGRLAVPDGDAVVPVINKMMEAFSTIVLTQDWHPSDHLSLVSNHPGQEVFTTVPMAYGPQILWPDHCVQSSEGAAFHPDLRTDPADLIIRKGTNPAIDSYSAFYENDRTTTTGLEGYLKARGVTEVVLTGLATDFCVLYSALDARALGFSVTLVEAACRGIDLDGSMAAAWDQMQKAGVNRVSGMEVNG